MTQEATVTAPAGFETILAERDRWLAEQIRQLSVDALSQGTFTCTECGAIAGDYIIQHDGHELRLSISDAYAFLKFVSESN